MTPARNAVALASSLMAAFFAWQITIPADQPETAPGDPPAGGRPAAAACGSPAPSAGVTLEVVGRTQPVPGRVGVIAPAVLHPVTRVLAAPGDRVKAGQPLVEIDADEPEADVRAKGAAVAELEAGLARLKAMPREDERAEARATLEAARVATEAARQCHERLDGLRQVNAVTVRQHQEARAARLRAEAEERAAAAHLACLSKQPVAQEIAEMEARLAAARAMLEAAEAEREHYTVTAPIDGVIGRLDVSPGTVSRPGTSVWGEILDLREIDVRCEVTSAQADRLALGQPAEVSLPGSSARDWGGRIICVGNAADPRTGRVPVVLRIGEARERLRSHVEVVVRFGPAAPGEAASPEDAPAPPGRSPLAAR
jgi:multidrug resistance efflux pump